MASWPKLATPEDGRKYVHDRVQENADYIKVSVDTKYGRIALKDLHDSDFSLALTSVHSGRQADA